MLLSWLTLVVTALAVMVLALLVPRHGLPMPARLILSIFIALVMAVIGLALCRRRVTIEGRELVVAATLFTRRIGVDALDLPKARIVDLAERTEFAPMLKLGGYELPGFQAGSFLLHNRMRAFCLLSDRSRVLVLPRSDDRHLLLLSPEQPQALLAALNALAAPQTHR